MMSEKEIFTQAISFLNELKESAKTDTEAAFISKYGKTSNTRIPFLLPTHFCMSVLLYRSRLQSSIDENEDLTSPSTFSYVPLDFAKNKPIGLGRCNYTGQSVFYASLNYNTNFIEISKDSDEHIPIFLSVWEKEENIPFEIYRAIPIFREDNTFSNVLGKKLPIEIASSPEGDYLTAFSDLITNKEDGNASYLPTALICNTIFNYDLTTLKSQGFNYRSYDGITYASVRDLNGVNVAIRPSYVDEHLRLKYVYKGIVEKGKPFILESVGICENNVISWYRRNYSNFVIKEFAISLDNSSSICSDYHIYDSNKAEEIFPEQYFYYFVDHLDMSKTSLEEKHSIVDLEKGLPFEEVSQSEIRINVNWLYVDKTKTLPIDMIRYVFEYTVRYEKTN